MTAGCWLMPSATRLGVFLAALLLATFVAPPAVPADDGAAIDFARQIAPLLSDRCVACHNAGLPKGGLDLSTAKAMLQGGDSGPAITAGAPDESPLLEQITPAADGGRAEMPKKGEPLSAAQVALVRRWIAAGASWPAEITLREKAKADRSWWSLQPLVLAEPPAIDRAPPAWNEHPIDRFVFAELKAKGLTPSPAADKRALIRRATYDLLGVPPTPEEVEAFARDERPDAYERLVDRLLAAPQHGEQWGRHWLDVVRFGESVGFERNIIIDNAWPFRDYVIRSLNDDKPFNRLVLEHLAGDVIGKDQPDVEVGTTFLVAGPYDNVGNQDPVQAAQIRANTLDEIVTATGSALLGLTINCARCHDHKFDPIPQEDYYRLQSALAGVYHGDRALATAAEREKFQSAQQPLAAREDLLKQEKTALLAAAIERAQQDPALAKREYRLPAVHPHGVEDRFAPVQARQVRMTASSNDRQPQSVDKIRVDEFEVWTAGDVSRNVALAANGGAAQAASAVPGDFAGAYSAALTIDGKYGESWVSREPRLTITFAQPETIERVIFSSDRPKSYEGRGATNVFVGEYILEVSLDGQTWIKVADSLDRPPIDEAFARERLLRNGLSAADRERIAAIERELADVDAQLKKIPPLNSVWAGTFKQPTQATYLMQGGDPAKKGATVHPASLAVLERAAGRFELSPNAPEAERRLALATWIVGDENPLPLRVLANRVWHYHFGVGIVDTPSDFGFLGGRPTHPALLDWLAGRLRSHGWRLKPLHREIMLSQTYRQSGAFRADAARVDASARLLWRFPPRRLAAEEVRDTVLSIAGKLDGRMGGPGFRLYRYLQDNVATYVPLDEHDPTTFRRAVYHQNARASRIDLLSDFDSPDCSFSAPSRAATTSPLQALTLMNQRFTLDMARCLAERIERDVGCEEPERCVRRAFVLAYARQPQPREQEAAVALVNKHGLAALCRAMLNSNELIFLE